MVFGTAVRVAERVGRLKPNGRLLRRSPLTDLVEIEGLLGAVSAKATGWQALHAVEAPPWAAAVDLDELAARAASQLDRLRTIHRAVADRVLAERTG